MRHATTCFLPAW